jgi:hypothetical protein
MTLRTLFRSFPAAALALAAGLPAAAAPSAVPPGEYVYVQGGSAHGAMTVAGGGFSIATTGGNCHECSITGRFSGKEGLADDQGLKCRFGVSVGPQSARIEIADDAQKGCSDFCGMRAMFAGDYRKAPPACTDKARAARLEQARGAYRAKDYAAARTGLRGLIAECASFMDWMEVDRERNDLALAEFHAGDPAQCLKVLAETTAAGAKDAEGLELPPCDKDNYLPVAKSTWHNEALCQAALKR